MQSQCLLGVFFPCTRTPNDKFFFTLPTVYKKQWKPNCLTHTNQVKKKLLLFILWEFSTSTPSSPFVKRVERLLGSIYKKKIENVLMSSGWCVCRRESRSTEFEFFWCPFDFSDRNMMNLWNVYNYPHHSDRICNWIAVNRWGVFLGKVVTCWFSYIW